MGKFWYQKQLRMLQTVFREPDIVNYDAAAVVDYLKRTYSNCIIVNAGGIVDFFDNDTELGRRNSFMTTENMLGNLIRECHANGIHVMVRVDFRGVEEARYEQRPDWFAKEPDGSAKMGWNKIHRPCYNSVYSNDHAVTFIHRMMEKYDIDGVWENCVGFGDGPCYCQKCQTMFREETGQEIPVSIAYDSDEFAKYRAWKAKCADAHLRRMRDAVKSHGEDKAFCAEIFGMFHASNALRTGIDLYNAREYFDFLVSPAFQDGSANPGRKWDTLTYAASSMRFLKAIDKDRQSVLLYGNNGTKWRYVKAPTAETKIWMWEAASVGAGFWNCMFNGQHPGRTLDRRNQGIETEAYRYLKDNEEFLDGQCPKSDVGIFYSRFSRDALGNDSEEKDRYGVFIKGVERALIESHIPYGFILDQDFTRESLREIQTLVLPNAALMSDEQINIIREYVRDGGGLVASYESSLYDEKGKRRADFGLGDVFGVSFTGIRKDTSFDCYQLIRRAHSVLERMGAEETSVIMNEGSTLLCRPLEGKESGMICSYIPMIYNQPPEYAWIPEMRTDYPTIMENTYGKGKVVYFSNQTDKLVFTNGHEDFLDTFINAVNWTRKEEFSLEVKAPSSVHVVLMEKKAHTDQKVVSFVNTTGGWDRPMRSICPVYDIEALVTLGEGDKLKATVMKGDGNVTVEEMNREGKRIARILVRELKDFAAVSIQER